VFPLARQRGAGVERAADRELLARGVDGIPGVHLGADAPHDQRGAARP
jgi:hypothetical protein